MKPRPSRAVPQMRFTPSTELTTSSIGFSRSFSTASGDAPGYSTEMLSTGTDTSGSFSTGRRWYENTPSTSNATMTMVANTG